MDRWRGYLEDGLRRMRAAGLLQPHADPQMIALSILATLQDGLLLTQTMQSLKPLERRNRGRTGDVPHALTSTAANLRQ